MVEVKAITEGQVVHTVEKYLIPILIVEDEISQKDLLEKTLAIYNQKGDRAYGIKADFCDKADESLVKLLKNDYQAAIVDLKLTGDEFGDDLTGNKLVDIIASKLRMPIIIRSGTPNKFDSLVIEDSNKLVEIYSKDDRINDIFDRVIKWYNIGLTSSIGSKGFLDRMINEIYWKKISSNIEEWEKVGKKIDNHKPFLRYTLNILQSYLEIDEETNQFDNYHPAEMFIIPPIKQTPFFGDILKDPDANYYIILTPSCELAQNKSENALIVKIIPFEDVTGFITDRDTYLSIKDLELSNGNKKKIDKFAKWFRNGTDNSLGYHFLPSFSVFPGGFIDFQQISTIPFDAERKIDEKYIKIATISNHFSKDISARFTSYYGRQGQPSLNNQIIFNTFS